MTPDDVERLMRFEGIVRNRLKIESAVRNAKLFTAVQKEFGSFYEYVLSFFPDRRPIVHRFGTLGEVPATSPESDAMSADMKRRGFKFFGSTICYAFCRQRVSWTTIWKAAAAGRENKRRGCANRKNRTV